MSQTYTKSLSSDFNNLLNSSQLDKIIRDEPNITSGFLGVNLTVDDVNFLFISNVSSEEKTIIDTITSNYVYEEPTENVSVVKIQEEVYETGGHFNTTSMKIIAVPNTTTTVYKSFSYPINAFNVNFITKDEHEGDVVSLSVNKNKIIGIINENVSPSTEWVSQNYTKGQTVSSGGRFYTCIKDTVSSEIVYNTDYWRRGIKLSVSSTVLQHSKIGMVIDLFDGVNSDIVGDVVSKDILNNCIYVEKSTVNSFSSGSYVRITVYTIQDFILGPAGKYSIGNSKIGGSYIQADYNIVIDYTNNSNTEKTFVGNVEFLR